MVVANDMVSQIVVNIGSGNGLVSYCWCQNQVKNHGAFFDLSISNIKFQQQMDQRQSQYPDG